MKNFLLFLSLFIPFHWAIGQEMITDFYHEAGDKSSSPKNFIEFDSKIFFSASTESYGNEIWVYDASNSKPTLFKDINFGKNSSYPGDFIKFNDNLYFIASDENLKREMWKTDGTPKGTEKIADFYNHKNTKLTVVDNKIFFLGNYTNELWVSDGTKEGTKIVKKDIPTGGAAPSFAGKCNNTFIFTLLAPNLNKSKVWRSDGTAEGTYPITEEISGNIDGDFNKADPSQYIKFKNKLYFVTDQCIYKTDGTLENTTYSYLPYELNAEKYRYSFTDVIEVNGNLYFSFVNENKNSLKIWKYDGTENGNKIVYRGTSNYYFPASNLLKTENSLIFCSVNETGGTALAELNLTDHSVKYIKELETVIEPEHYVYATKNLSKIQYYDDNKIFCCSPTDSCKSTKGWIYDMTNNTITHVEGLNNVYSVYNYQNSLYFSKQTKAAGVELWKSDGTDENTFLFENINMSKYGLIPEPLASVNSDLIFTRSLSHVPLKDIWKYNGENILLTKLNIWSSQPVIYQNLKNEVLFIPDYGFGFEIWKTDGSASGTKIINYVQENKPPFTRTHLTLHKDIVYFFALKNNSYHLLKTQGNSVDFVKDLGKNIEEITYQTLEMISDGNFLYFTTKCRSSNPGSSHMSLWISDGTETGTNILSDFSHCGQITAANDKLFFTAQERNYGNDGLWVTDGTTEGTRLVKSFETNYFGLLDLIVCNETLYFTTYTEENGKEIWKSDGTKEGTKILLDIVPGSTSSIKKPNFCIANNFLFFVSTTKNNGEELWKTDGTEQGTTLVKDINPGTASSFPTELYSANDFVYFQAYDKEHGFELWKSDGTENNTTLVHDVYPGIQSSFPSNIYAVDNDIYFYAESENHGQQIWKVSTNSNSIPEQVQLDKTSIYPNPCVDNIYFKADIKNQNVSFYNTNGQLVSIKTIRNNNVNTSNLPSGVYIMKFHSKGQEVSKKIIKK